MCKSAAWEGRARRPVGDAVTYTARIEKTTNLEASLLRPILDVLLQKPIFKIDILDRTARDIVEG